VKHFLLLLFLHLLAHSAMAQAPIGPAELASFYDKLPVVQTLRYTPEPGYERQFIRSDFSTADLGSLRLGSRQLVRVDLVYTAFHLDPAFNQRQLNLDRLRNLAARLPQLLTNEALTWNLVEQTGCRAPATCQGYFHGFVLYFEKRYLATDTRREADSLSALLTTRLKKLDKLRAAPPRRGVPIPCHYPLSHYDLKALTKRVKRHYTCPNKQPQAITFSAEVNKHGFLDRVTITDPLAACPQELALSLKESLSFANGFLVGKERFPFVVTGRVQLPVRRHGLTLTGYHLADSVVRRYRIRLNPATCTARRLRPGEPTEDDPPTDPDANIFTKVLTRHPEWNQQVVVADVTGSMVPYTLDLLTWLQLSAKREAKTFVFFNDGDDAPDATKAIGSTGGLYAITTASFDAIKDKVLQAMRAGGGGDAPENDGEAIRYALQLAPGTTEVILLADNHTFPRDTRLLDGLPARLHIILCGASRYINPRYLALARAKGFTLHTLEHDLTTLSTLLEGTTITILNVQYLVTKDGFKPVKML
jgi:hypothetical protein